MENKENVSFADLYKHIREQDNIGNAPLYKKIIKIQEECGELAASFLLEDGYKFNKKNLSQEDIRINTEEEVADIFIMDLCIANTLDIEPDRLLGIIYKKIDEWAENMKKKKLQTSKE